MILTNNLPKTVIKKKKRIGRGGNRGKNAGYGHKGQIKRSGKSRVGFEGGARSFIRRVPKLRGYNFTGKNKRQLETLTIGRINIYFADNETVDLQSLKSKGLIDEKTKKVRIINSGSLTKKITFVEDENIYLTKGTKVTTGML